MKNNYILKNILSKNFNFNKRNKVSNFSTLVVPQIIYTGSQSKLHQTVYNLSTAAHQLDKDIHLLLYSNGNISEELLDEAKKVKNVTKILKFTADEKINLKEPTAELMSELVASIHLHINEYDNIITSSNNFGKNYLPRVGGLLNIQPLSEISKIEDSKNTFSRYFYAGNAISKIESQQKPNLMTIRITSFEKSVGINHNTPEVVDISKNDEINMKLSKIRTSTFVENLVSKSDKIELSQAKVVISGGRALKSSENFKLVEDLAACFENSAVGASRAAVDAGYVPNDLQVGQTGKVVAPELYFAIGISGAIQHVAGMKDSKVIVAINSDPDCPIFNIATYGLVGDLFKILPELTEKIKLAKE
jgi:electron transfer flavoprotein alpha subunit